ncbi:MAG: hypothetical protein JXX14_15180 [Deltaproteobacteria bacterium]|nr:hypothetical protein [Deltaproteobacteria bacterium]
MKNIILSITLLGALSVIGCGPTFTSCTIVPNDLKACEQNTCNGKVAAIRFVYSDQTAQFTPLVQPDDCNSADCAYPQTANMMSLVQTNPAQKGKTRNFSRCHVDDKKCPEEDGSTAQISGKSNKVTAAIKCGTVDEPGCVSYTVSDFKCVE